MTVPAPFTVVIPTRDRPLQVLATLDALAAQTRGGFGVIVVDDSAEPDPELDRRAAEAGPARLRVIREPGRGLSRARNIGWRAATTEWVALLDDDVVPEPDWAQELEAALARHPDAGFVSGFVGATGKPPGGEYVEVTVSPVVEERVLSGPRTLPWAIGFTLCMAVRRDVLEALGGFDDRLGPGVAAFPSSEDMDFNYRFLRAGGVAFTTPRVRANHDQWRDMGRLAPHFRGYAAGWSGFAMKHLRSGDVRGGLWLWSLGARDVLRMTGSAVRRRSRLRSEVAAAKWRGLASGTLAGVRRAW